MGQSTGEIAGVWRGAREASHAQHHLEHADIDQDLNAAAQHSCGKGSRFPLHPLEQAEIYLNTMAVKTIFCL